MARATKVTVRKGKDKPLEPLTLSVGWQGRLGEIVSILERGNPAGNLAPRPLRAVVAARLDRSAALARALTKGDRFTAERIARRIVAAVLAPGIKPVNRPSTTRRKKGDRRALRNTRGRDAIFRLYKVFVRNLKSGRFG